MKKSPNIPLLVIIGLFTLFSLIIIISISSARMSNNAETQLKLSFITTSLGSLVALISAVFLLFRGVSGNGFRELLPLTLPLLAGVLIASFHWAVAVVIGLLTVSLFVKEMVGTPQDRRSKGKKTSPSIE